MTKARTTGAAIGLVIAMMACGGTAANHDMTPSARPNRAVLITVRNDNWLDVNVYRVRSGAQFRLGTVSALSVGTFMVPEALVGGDALRLRIDPIGSNNVYTTDPIIVAPDQRVQLNVAERLSMSTFSIWNHTPRR
jgi:hypothetical protein